ncbi:hypothetical protein, partial [Neisseria meningitidis]|uniref:hypothetical protein n=1 Tax=Neisseria meningitidis TaxID=487 RepID=UPI0019614267
TVNSVQIKKGEEIFKASIRGGAEWGGFPTLGFRGAPPRPGKQNQKKKKKKKLGNGRFSAIPRFIPPY